MAGRRMHSLPNYCGGIACLALLLLSCTGPATATTPQFDIAADLGGVFAKSLQLLRSNLNSVFGTSSDPVSSRVLQETNSTDCLLPVWTCPSCINVPDSVYQTVLNTTCEPVTGLDLFVCGPSILDATVVDAVKSGQCARSCPGSQPSLQCPASTTGAPRPAQASPSVSTPAMSPTSLTSPSPATPSPASPSPPSPIISNAPSSSPQPFATPQAGATFPLPAGCLSSDARYACTYDGCTTYASPAMYDYINAASTTCTTVLNRVICGCYALDQPTYDAVTKGSCTLNCPQQSKMCGGAPAPAPTPAASSPTLFGRPSPAPTSLVSPASSSAPPAGPPEPTSTLTAVSGSGASPSSSPTPSTPVPASPETNPSVSPPASPSAGTPPAVESGDVPAASPYPLPSTPSSALPPVSGPALAPAIAPEACPAPTCLRPQYQCGAMSQYRLSLALHTAIDEATSCTPDLDPAFCIVDEYIVELPIWEAVKASNCSYRCLEGSSLTCPARAPAPAPATSPASSPAATASPRASPVAAPTVTPTLTPTPTPTPVANASWAAPTPAEPSLAALAPFALKYGPYGDCSVQCGNGNVTRALTCVSQAYGLPVELGNCQYTAATIANLTKSCSQAACGQYSFVVSPWGSCSSLCGSSGTASRNVTCMHNGAEVDATSDEYTQNCLPLGEPISVQPCFATPCEPYMWRTAAWSNCTSGLQNRTVSCQRAKGGSADASVCTAQLGYTASSSRLCNTFACTSTADCSNNGVCDAATSACQCQSGFTGPNCGISTGLCNSTASASNSTAAAAGNSSQICCSTGVVDSAGGCCDSGVVSEAGSCCAAGPSANMTLDREGQCCSETLDACGVCGGDGLTLDFTGVCCNGAIDASGLCCASPNVVDDFGVCGGNSSTGVIVLDLDVLSSSVAGLSDANSSGHDTFATGYEALLASVLSVPASQAELQSLQTGTAPAPVPARRRLLTSQTTEASKQSSSGTWSSRFQRIMLQGAQIAHLESLLGAAAQPITSAPAYSAITPVLDASLVSSQGVMSRSLLAAAPYTVSTTAAVSPPYAELTYPKVQALIQSAYSNTTNSAGLAVKSLRSVSKQGVAGNGVCETGEMPSAAENFTGVPADCPIKFHAIPASSGKAACSGHGAPVAALGTCQCYVGYDGAACDACADGYQRTSGVCQRTLTSFKAQAALAALAQSTASKKTSGASIGMIAGAVIAGVAAMLVALALFTTYRRRRSPNRHVYMGAKGATGRTSGAFTAASSQGSQSSSGLSGGMAWAFQDPEHGSTTSKASGAPTTTFVNPEYQPVTNRSQVMAREAESSLSGQQRSNFKMVLVNNKPMHSWYNWLTAAGISEDQVEVRKLGEGERDTERGPASPLPAKKPSLLKRAYDLTIGNPADSTASSARRAGAGTAFSIMEPQYSEMDRQAADKKARRGSLAFSNSSEAATDSSSGASAGRGMYGLTMGEGGSDGIGRGGQSARRGGMTLFAAAPAEADDARKAAKSNIYGTMAFSDVEKENEVGLMKRISKGWKRGSSSQGSGSTISSSGADSRGSTRSGAMGSIAFTGSSGGRSRNNNLLMETNMAFENGSDGGRTKRSHGTGFFAFSQAAEEEEERRSNRPNYALSEDLTAPQGTPIAVPGGARRLPLKELSHAESILSTQSTRRNYAYSLEAAPDAHPTRKHLNTFSAVDATDDAEEAGQIHVKNPSQASLATSTSGSDQSAAQLLRN